MRALLAGLVLFVVACGSSTDLGNQRDPSLLFTNALGTPVYLTWQDGEAILGRDTIPPHSVGHCSHFLAQPDSAYFQIVASNDENGAQTVYTAPWFNPESRPAWTVDVTADRTGGSPNIVVNLVDEMCS